jgi:hypothetical protein
MFVFKLMMIKVFLFKQNHFRKNFPLIMLLMNNVQMKIFSTKVGACKCQSNVSRALMVVFSLTVRLDQVRHILW